MNKLNSFGTKRTYDDFKKHVPIKGLTLFDSIREYCISLDKHVVEDIRMHRIVFGKSISFRWFADISPNENSITVKIQKNRKESPKIFELNFEQNLDEIKKMLKEAFDEIH